MGDAVAVVAALAAQRQSAVPNPVEASAELDEITHGGGPLAYEEPHGVLVTETRPGGERVSEVLLGRVVGSQRCSDAALRPARRPRREHVLRHQHDVQRRMPGNP
jgi:hypothetical protein